jgi:hypothetical protein
MFCYSCGGDVIKRPDNNDDFCRCRARQGVIQTTGNGRLNEENARGESSRVHAEANLPKLEEQQQGLDTEADSAKLNEQQQAPKAKGMLRGALDKLMRKGRK